MGHIGKGAQALLSKGTSNPHDQSIQDQLSKKHPQRKEDIALPTDEQLQHTRAELDPKQFAKALRSLNNLIAPGLGGLRNEHLLALVFPDFSGASSEAQEAENHLFQLAQLITKGALPPYFYTCYTAVRCIPINKQKPEDLQDGATMDCRPVGIGNAIRRLITKTLFDQFVGAFNAVTAPMQYGCGEKAGGTKMIFSVKVHTEANPTHATMSIDVANAFNEAKRAEILQALWTHPTLRPLWYYCYSTLLPISYVGVGSSTNLTNAPFFSVEGTQQGAI